MSRRAVFRSQGGRIVRPTVEKEDLDHAAWREGEGCGSHRAVRMTIIEAYCAKAAPSQVDDAAPEQLIDAAPAPAPAPAMKKRPKK